MNTLRVQVVKTTRTDLICIHCGMFGGGQPMLALVAPDVDSKDAVAGVHRACIRKIKARRKRPEPKESDIPPSFRTGLHAESDCPCTECECRCHVGSVTGLYGGEHLEAECPCRECTCTCHEVSRTEPAPAPTHDDDEASDGLV